MNHAKRTDRNQAELVAWLRANGFKVHLAHAMGEGFPDLVVGGEMPCPFCHVPFWQEKLIEVKTPTGKLNPVQLDWWERWNGKASVAHNWEELAALVGRTGGGLVRVTQEGVSPDQAAGTAQRDAPRKAQPGRTRRLSQTHRTPGLSDSGDAGAE